MWLLHICNKLKRRCVQLSKISIWCPWLAPVSEIIQINHKSRQVTQCKPISICTIAYVMPKPKNIMYDLDIIVGCWDSLWNLKQKELCSDGEMKLSPHIYGNYWLVRWSEEIYSPLTRLYMYFPIYLYTREFKIESHGNMRDIYGYGPVNTCWLTSRIILNLCLEKTSIFDSWM